MYKIGYLDDEDLEYDNYRIDLLNYDMDLLKIENIKTKMDLRNAVLSFQLDCLIIDYNLNKFKQKEIQDGNELVRYINSEIPDFPCIILTSYPGESKDEKTVINSFILDRDLLTNDTDGVEYKSLVEKIINNIEVYKNRLKLNKLEYDALLKKRNSTQLNVSEEDRLISLYKVLYAYRMVDEINPELLRKDLEIKLNSVITKLKDLLGE